MRLHRLAWLTVVVGLIAASLVALMAVGHKSAVLIALMAAGLKAAAALVGLVVRDSRQWLCGGIRD